jgi:two-component system, OmpR family, KDP operon response regulator KdpE
MIGRVEGPGRVLLVEDERLLRRALAMNLSARGWQVTEAADGTTGLAAAASTDPQVVVLDLGLPDLDGVDVVRGIRAWSTTPILVLSARTDSLDKVKALDAGADDYVTKPFDVDELLARLRAVTRRGATTTTPGSTVVVGDVTVDLDATTATHADGTTVRLTPTEWRLLAELVRVPGRLVSGPALLRALRGSPDHTDPSYLRIYVAQLRRKLEPDPAHPRHLITEPGMGYRFVP